MLSVSDEGSRNFYEGGVVFYGFDGWSCGDDSVERKGDGVRGSELEGDLRRSVFDLLRLLRKFWATREEGLHGVWRRGEGCLSRWSVFVA